MGNDSRAAAQEERGTAHPSENLAGRRVMRKNTVLDFWKQIKQSGDCWLWAEGKNVDRYTQFCLNGKRIHAHRFIYELLIGPIPPELELDHLCRNPACVNPFHLEAVTHRVNVLRGKSPPARNAAKTHCRNGHPLKDSYVRPNGERLCRVCHRTRSHIHYHASSEKSRASRRERNRRSYWEKQRLSLAKGPTHRRTYPKV